jgi:hypothetical protein
MKFTSAFAALALFVLPALAADIVHVDNPLGNPATKLSDTACAGAFSGATTLKDIYGGKPILAYFGASSTAPCGTCLKVINPANNAYVIVLIVDHVNSGTNIGPDAMTDLQAGSAGSLPVIIQAADGQCGI